MSEPTTPWGDWVRSRLTRLNSLDNEAPHLGVAQEVVDEWLELDEHPAAADLRAFAAAVRESPMSTLIAAKFVTEREVYQPGLPAGETQYGNRGRLPDAPSDDTSN